MKILKWLKENLLIVLLLFVVFIFVLDDCSDDSGYKKDIKASDKKIQGLMDDNKEKDKVITDAIKMAEKAEAVVAKKEKMIAARDVQIKELQKKEAEIPAIVEAMEPPSVVLRTIELLDCAEIELKDDQVIFTLACAKKNLIFLDQTDAIRGQRDMLSDSLIDCQEALTFQKIATFNVYRIAWALSWKVSNWKEAYNEKDKQFQQADKERKRARRKDLVKGVIVGAVLTVIIVILRGRK